MSPARLTFKCELCGSTVKIDVTDHSTFKLSKGRMFCECGGQMYRHAARAV